MNIPKNIRKIINKKLKNIKMNIIKIIKKRVKKIIIMKKINKI